MAGKFTAEERAAMRERARELKGKGAGESDVLAKIAEMPGADRAMAERIHALVKKSAPELTPKTWYGMPAYAKDGKVVCFFQSGEKFKARYATFGFSVEANLDEGNMWASSFALKKLTAPTRSSCARSSSRRSAEDDAACRSGQLRALAGGERTEQVGDPLVDLIGEPPPSCLRSPRTSPRAATPSTSTRRR